MTSTLSGPGPAVRDRRSALAGVGPLLRVTLRQEARVIAPWVVLVSALSASSVLAYAFVFPDAADRAALATSLGANPALSLIFGPARDLMTADGFNAWRTGQLGAFFTGLMAVLVVVRNSRADEDSGQAELVASGVLARASRLAVAVLMAAIASAAVGVVSFLVTIASGGDVVATLVLASTYTASGLMFAGVAAVSAQVGSDARTASSMAVATLGVLYVLRGYIDSSDAPDWASWLTPLGWLAETRPSTENDSRPLLLALALTTILVVAAFALQARRDFGQGVIAQRPGPAEAGVAGNVWGLALKLHRGSLVSWLIALAGLGLLFGTLVTSIGDLLADNPAMADVLAAGGASSGSFTFAFLVTILQIIAILAAVMGVQVALRIHAEEIDHRVEPLLAASLRRPTYLASNAVIALLGPAMGMFLAGTSLGVVAHSRDDTIAIGDVTSQAVAAIPAVWVLVGLGLAAVGAAPGLRLIGWVGVVATFGLTILGPTLDLPDRVLDISPLRHVPDVTSATPDWSGVTGLLLGATALVVVAFAGFRRRDVG